MVPILVAEDPPFTAEPFLPFVSLEFHPFYNASSSFSQMLRRTVKRIIRSTSLQLFLQDGHFRPASFLDLSSTICYQDHSFPYFSLTPQSINLIFFSGPVSFEDVCSLGTLIFLNGVCILFFLLFVLRLSSCIRFLTEDFFPVLFRPVLFPRIPPRGGV